ncbi:ribosomal protein L20A (L18A) [Xanthomonas campestris]|nr:ribosomal protein L20A (L18A) [Xanthomonas sp. 3075]
MKAFHVRGIVWETDGKRPALPMEATVECASEEDIADRLAMLTDGW